MKTRACLSVIVSAVWLLLPACNSDRGHEHGGASGHAHGAEGAEDHPHGEGADHDHHGGAGHAGDDEGGHGHGGHDGASEVVTLWGARTQLFVEFPALVVGEESPFAAHLTRLRDHLAVDRGTVIVTLSGGGQAPESFSVSGPKVAGIFRPVIRPAHVGLRRVTLRLDSPLAAEVHDMGEFEVFATRAAADAAAPHEHEPDGQISFLLEQQWPIPFLLQRVKAREMRASVPAFARLTLPNDADVMVTAARDGRVAAVGGRFVAVGESVAAGRPLVSLHLAPQEAGDAASLDLATERARIRVSAAQREVERLTSLVNQGVVPQRRLDEATSARAEAKAELRSARRRKDSLGQSQRIEGAGDALDVPSPIAGVIAEVFVAPGTWVTQGQRIARVVDRGRLWLDVGVPEAYVGKLREVSGAWFLLDNYDGVFEVDRSTLISIGVEVDPETRTLPIRFGIANVRGELFAGMTTQAQLITGPPQLSVGVPHTAVIDDAGVDVVYVQTGGESFERRPVKLGVRDGDYVEAFEGVVPGEWVVTRGAYSVKLASTSAESVGHGHAH